ncbi:MAG: RIP metalloprotease RseP [Fusobacteriia bacterium 4572_132]|nr:MAG: RIP metalloprotease RseP [Fusobacteriia bacterium 4572_132]
MSILLTLLILTVIIFIHELGHFATAKYFKIPVSEFAIGMGPKLISKQVGETLYAIRAIPIGGFVNIEGMEPDSEIENGFNTKAAYKRFIVLFAGVFMNFVLAFLIVAGMVFTIGGSEQNPAAVIGQVADDSYAKEQLKSGDEILKIDEMEIKDWDSLVNNLSAKKDEKVELFVKRGNEELKINTKLKYIEDQKRFVLGVFPEYTKIKYGIVAGSKEVVKQYVNLFNSTFKGFKMLFAGEVKKEDISGPVGTVKIVKMFANWGVSSLIFLTALLSINIGIINLFPLPALDGGRILFVILEKIGVKVNKNTEEKIHKAGFILLLGLIFVVTFNDIINLLK